MPVHKMPDFSCPDFPGMCECTPVESTTSVSCPHCDAPHATATELTTMGCSSCGEKSQFCSWTDDEGVRYEGIVKGVGANDVIAIDQEGVEWELKKSEVNVR